MRKITQDVAEKLYRHYSVTVMEPVSLDELMPVLSIGGVETDFREVDDRILYAYVRKIAETEMQVIKLRSFQKKADLTEPYNIGFMNCLIMMMYILDGKELEYLGKPVDTKTVIKELEDAIDEAADDMCKLALQIEDLV